jgi:hypothetical protein
VNFFWGGGPAVRILVVDPMWDNMGIFGGESCGIVGNIMW